MNEPGLTHISLSVDDLDGDARTGSRVRRRGGRGLEHRRGRRSSAIPTDSSSSSSRWRTAASSSSDSRLTRRAARCRNAAPQQRRARVEDRAERFGIERRARLRSCRRARRRARIPVDGWARPRVWRPRRSPANARPGASAAARCRSARGSSTDVDDRCVRRASPSRAAGRARRRDDGRDHLGCAPWSRRDRSTRPAAASAGIGGLPSRVSRSPGAHTAAGNAAPDARPNSSGGRQRRIGFQRAGDPSLLGVLFGLDS